MTNAVLLPHVLELNFIKIQDKINRLSDYIGIENGYDGFLSFIQDLNSFLNVPNGLSELGVLEEDIDRIINSALKDPSKDGNPIKLNAKNLRAVLETAM